MSKKNVYKSPDRKEKITLRLLILLGLLSIVNFFYWFLKPELIDNHFLYWLLIGSLTFDSLRIVYIWYHYWDISVTEKPKRTKNPTVDVFTTYFPGEPYDMIKDTLLAIQRIKYPHTTYLCDEADDLYLKEFCKENGIKHVKRNNRIDAKAGNINNALLQANGEICLILDPDHVPKENFLDEIVPYFEDEKIGFVQTVQAYYNTKESYVAKGAAEQTFHFYGPIMMTMNSYGTVNAIGANCCFRRKALDSIGGHAAGLSEDMHTAMQLYAKGWKSVYVPEVYTKGLVPSTLTSYYKQQIKWSRGTLELLVSVFPKLLKKFTWRQKIHFGILPLYYLSGIFYLVTFLIPIISLFFATMPWKGNIINFGIIFLPVFISILGVRFYVQRWVIDKSERGTHLMGGVLLSCTWWIFILGFFYTVIRKKVPYLPTPKNDKELTNWKILIPNIMIGVVSVIAVVYGLYIDLTPFSIFMSGFALLNAFFMFYTIMFAYQKQKFVKLNFDIRNKENSFFNRLRNFNYNIWHEAALPLFILIMIIIGIFHYKMEYKKWGGVLPEIQHKNVINYIGVFAPSEDNGISNLHNVKDVSNLLGEKFDIVSIYIPWEKNPELNFPVLLLDSIYSQKSIPMITWEPWLTSFEDIPDGNHVFDLIVEGYFDKYITKYAENLKSLQKPVFLRFAHEFDNPFYPWYLQGNDASSKFKKAWIHTIEIFRMLDVANVIWIWNPWKPESVESYYPGEEYVDWIGVNILNYGMLNPDGESHDFKELYKPFNEVFKNIPFTPVIISEFGTLKNAPKQKEWIENAFYFIENEFSEIKSVVYFNSNVDDNWPAGLQLNKDLDWTVSETHLIKNFFNGKDAPIYVFSSLPESGNNETLDLPGEKNSLTNIKGINVKIGHDWRKEYHVLNLRKLQSDFKNIKHLGINTIKFVGNTIYSYNILNTAKELGLNVSYGFWVPADLDFVNDSLKTIKLKNAILKEIGKNKHNHQIISWNIQNDVLYNQKDYYHKPELLFQNRAYIIWLKNLMEEINKVDKSRPVIVDIEINNQTIYYADLITENMNGHVLFGLVVKDETNLSTVIHSFESTGKEYLYSEIDVKTLDQYQIPESQNPFYITAWQDMHQNNKLSFDGITDRKGRFKTDYYTAQNIIKKAGIPVPDYEFRILKQAIPVYSNNIMDYYALCYEKNEGWKYGESLENITFEWSLIKCDKYGNYLAVKDIGYGPILPLKIPWNHEYFKLLLTAINGDTIYTSVTTLNTPLIINETSMVKFITQEDDYNSMRDPYDTIKN